MPSNDDNSCKLLDSPNFPPIWRILRFSFPLLFSSSGSKTLDTEAVNVHGSDIPCADSIFVLFFLVSFLASLSLSLPQAAPTSSHSPRICMFGLIGFPKLP